MKFQSLSTTESILFLSIYYYIQTSTLRSTLTARPLDLKLILMGDRGWRNSGRDWENSHVQGFDRRKHPHFSGSAADYQEAHVSQYGGTERFDPDGRHVMADGSHEPCPSFPRGSSRERDHSTQPVNRTRRAYKEAQGEEMLLFGSLDEEQKAYYKHTSKGFVPSAHARLIPPARRFDEISNE